MSNRGRRRQLYRQNRLYRKLVHLRRELELEKEPDEALIAEVKDVLRAREEGVSDGDRDAMWQRVDTLRRLADERGVQA